MMIHSPLLSKKEQEQFAADGFFIRRALFTPDEAAAMLLALEGDPLIHQHMFDRRDNSGRFTRAVQWNNPGNSTYGIAARSRRVVGVIEALLGGEIYHWQSKLTAKNASDGGAWEWHQDYGYWYHNGCLYPHMSSVMIALDPCVEANGCLQVLRGSHQMGRIDHIRDAGGQVNADPQRIAWAESRHERVLCELEPGDALFFHCNTLHSSAPNTSNQRRWALLFCYNRASNDPLLKTHNPQYNPLTQVDDLNLDKHNLRFADGSEEFQSTYVKKQIESLASH